MHELLSTKVILEGIIKDLGIADSKYPLENSIFFSVTLNKLVFSRKEWNNLKQAWISRGGWKRKRSRRVWILSRLWPKTSVVIHPRMALRGSCPQNSGFARRSGVCCLLQPSWCCAFRFWHFLRNTRVDRWSHSCHCSLTR